MRTYSRPHTQEERAEAVRLWLDAVARQKAVDPADEWAAYHARREAQGLWTECRNVGVTFAELDAAGGGS